MTAAKDKSTSLIPTNISTKSLSNDSASRTFSEIIENDHNSINSCALRLRKATSISERRQLRDEVVWRLIRHDVSEDLVMRPAFSQHLGPEGQHFADVDRHDHDNARQEVLQLLDLPLDSPAFDPFVARVFKELAAHMRVESGQQIPMLEQAVSREDSERLANQYKQTEILTPSLVIDGKKIFNNLREYVQTDLKGFHRLWQRVQLQEQHKSMAKQRL